MNISQAARRSGVSAKMIRHYEAIGLISAERRSNNYRTYVEADIAVLRFILHARELAFPLEKIRQLLALWRGTPRCDKVLILAREHVSELERKAESYRAMAESLQRLASGCPGDGSPACPILDAFSAEDEAGHQARERARDRELA